MPRYIDIDKMNEWDREANDCEGIENCLGKRFSDCRDCYYDHGGAEDVAPVIHAEWKYKLADNGWKDIYCTNCNYTINTDIQCKINYKFCPNCGAKMDKE